MQTQQGASGELRLECWRQGAGADPGAPPADPTGPAAAPAGAAWALAAAHAPSHGRDARMGTAPMALTADGSVALLGGNGTGRLAALSGPDWKVLLHTPASNTFKRVHLCSLALQAVGPGNWQRPGGRMVQIKCSPGRIDCPVLQGSISDVQRAQCAALSLACETRW